WTEGCEQWADSSTDEMYTRLGLPQKKIPLFNSLIHPKGAAMPGTAAWDVVKEKDGLIPLTPHWHQIIGIYKMVSLAFEGKPVLLMDEVGLGKTLQLLGFICVMIYFREFYDKWGKFPGDFADKKYPLLDRKSGNIPKLDNHVCVPTSLRDQFQVEFKRFVEPDQIDYCPYIQTFFKRKTFMRILEKFSTPSREGRRLIVSTQPTMKSDLATFVRAVFDSPEKPLQYLNGSMLPETIFGRNFLINAFDEAHYARTNNNLTTAIRATRERSSVTMAMTATPLMTKVADLMNIACALGLEPYSTNDAIARKRALERDIRTAVKKDRAAAKDNQITEQVLRGQTGPILQTEVLKAVAREFEDMRDNFKDIVIRRTSNSVDYLKAPILHLPPRIETNYFVELYKWEITNLENVAAATIEQGTVTMALGLGKNFYNHFRQAMCHPGCDDPALWFHPKTKEQWDEHPSKKLDVLAQILRHHLDKDNRHALVYDTENHVFSEPEYAPIDPSLEQSPPDRTSAESNPVPPAILHDTSVPTSETAPDKIVIYSAWPSSYDKIITAMRCNGITEPILELEGSMPEKARNAVIAQFNDPKGPRILLISNVGSVGLNLQIACVLVILDSLWSSLEERQIIGRIHRQNQVKLVRVYRIIALKIPDVFLNNISFAKTAMHDMFVG
ncbi:P-loop containing nucleoside triphosphate hydrolase protein, partial [Mycena floridula]